MEEKTLSEVQEAILTLLEKINAAMETEFFILVMAKNPSIGLRILKYLYYENPTEQELLKWVQRYLENTLKPREK